MQTSITVWLISTLNQLIKAKDLDLPVILNCGTCTDVKSIKDSEVAICCHINHIWHNELNIVKEPIMARNDMKSCRKVQMDTGPVSSVRRLLFRQHSEVFDFVYTREHSYAGVCLL